VFLEEDIVEYLRAEARKQMRERQVRALTDEDLAASVARTPAMTMVSPRAAARSAGKKPRIDLSGFNDDGTPKKLSELGG
jgi:hypothetical protein